MYTQHFFTSIKIMQDRHRHAQGYVHTRANPCNYTFIDMFVSTVSVCVCTATSSEILVN